jgi:class I fructose-bisphosphate aldolase
MVILPVDQGFEHGPARSLAPNPPAYDPRDHFELAIESGCNARKKSNALWLIETIMKIYAGAMA